MFANLSLLLSCLRWPIVMSICALLPPTISQWNGIKPAKRNVYHITCVSVHVRDPILKTLIVNKNSLCSFLDLSSFPSEYTVIVTDRKHGKIICIVTVIQLSRHVLEL